MGVGSVIPGWRQDRAVCQHVIRALLQKRSISNSKLSLSPLVKHLNTLHQSIYMGRGRGTTHNLLEWVDG